MDGRVHLVSVMGPSRTGKSFLMSFLTSGIRNGQIRGGFQAGYIRVTEGILIYREPVIVNVKGEERLVFFLDTQGVFDNQTDMAVSGWIAGLSMLISDVQIVNLMKNIDSEHLENIRRFTEFAASVPQAKLATSLVFLLRDSIQTNLTGQAFLERLWENCATSINLLEMSSMIRERFSDIHCVCSPMASRELRSASGEFCLQETDLPIIDSFNELMRYVSDQLAVDAYSTIPTIDYCKQAASYLEHSAPQITTSVAVMTEARMAVKVGEEIAQYETTLKKAHIHTIDQIHQEAKASGLHRIAVMDISRESIEKMQQMFIERTEAIYRENTEKFRIADAERVERAEMEKMLKSGRDRIYKLVSMDAALQFYTTQGLDQLVNTLLHSSSRQFSLSFQSNLRTTLEADFLNHAMHRIRPHFDDLEYRLSHELRQTIENGSFSSSEELNSPIKAQLRKIALEFETMRKILSISGEVEQAITTQAGRKFTEISHQAFENRKQILLKREEFEEQKQKQDEMIRELEKLEKQRIQARNVIEETISYEVNLPSESRRIEQSPLIPLANVTSLPQFDPATWEREKRRQAQERESKEFEKRILQEQIDQLEKSLQMQQQSSQHILSSDQTMREQYDKLKQAKLQLEAEIECLKREAQKRDQEWEKYLERNRHEEEIRAQRRAEEMKAIQQQEQTQIALAKQKEDERNRRQEEHQREIEAARLAKEKEEESAKRAHEMQIQKDEEMARKMLEERRRQDEERRNSAIEQQKRNDAVEIEKYKASTDNNLMMLRDAHSVVNRPQPVKAPLKVRNLQEEFDKAVTTEFYENIEQRLGKKETPDSRRSFIKTVCNTRIKDIKYRYKDQLTNDVEQRMKQWAERRFEEVTGEPFVKPVVVTSDETESRWTQRFLGLFGRKSDNKFPPQQTNRPLDNYELD